MFSFSILSITLQQLDVKEIGLSLFGLDAHPFLWMGKTLAIFQEVSSLLSLKDVSKI
jgi:hypothetical protein